MNLHGLYITLILIFPLVGGLISYAMGSKRAFAWALLGMIPGMVFSVIVLSLTIDQSIMSRWQWMPGYELGWYIDRTSALLICLVYLISLLVHLFSAYYLRGDSGIHRFYAILGFFTTSMLGLLAADHLLLVFIFWELVGFSSYLLIGFWYRDAPKVKSAREAFMVNRVADAGLLIGIILLMGELGQSYLSEIHAVPSGFMVSLAGLGLMVGALGKSAQFPFFGWLPKAMAGPTPVSALIHAATMVAVGVYLLIRVFPVLSPLVLNVTAVLGAMTAFMAAVAAMTQFDIKKVLAYSTISQLGYMVMGIGVNAYQSSLFHLWTHAFFKAGLFLGAGAVIHYFHRLHHHDHSFDAQDMRQMGGLRKVLPVTFVTFLICGLALSGLPLFSGFLSKEGILSGAWIWSQNLAADGYWVAYVVTDLALIAAFLTPIYIGRQILLVFFGEPRSEITPIAGIEPLFTHRLPLFVLALGALWIFQAFNPIDAHGWWLGEFLFGNNVLPEDSGTEQIELMTMILSIALAISGLAISYIFFKPGSTRMSTFKSAEIPRKWYGKISFNSWYIESMYDGISNGYLKLTQITGKIDSRVIDRIVNLAGVWTVVFSKVLAIIDREVIDGLVNFMAWLSKIIGNMFTGIQSGKIQNQLVWMITILLVILIWFQF